MNKVKMEKNCRKVLSVRKVTGAIRSLVSAWSLRLELARVLSEFLLVPVLMYGSETMVWKEDERSRIRAVQSDNFRDLLSMSRTGRIPNARVR